MINQAAFEAARRGGNSVSVLDIENAKDKLQLGHPRDNFSMPVSEAKKTAYHEGGHALIALTTKGSMPIYKATIMPRGSALGYVYQVPEKDTIHMTNQQMQARIDVALAGRAAEEIIYGSDKITTGCSNDLEHATELIMHMIVDCGFSNLGIVNEEYTTMSDSKKYKVEKEAIAILHSSYQRVR
uniref:ATP-dependent zinc metalloprotease FTSH 11, chloroplastic/mitochondrial n=1 Tax=Lygus hesperus TaxID=30085 RepID=A0A0A9WE42_LYGHE